MFVLDKDHHSINNLFKVFLFDYDVDESNILSQNLELFYCCIETISPTLRFYIRLLISLTNTRYELSSKKFSAIYRQKHNLRTL